MTRLVDDRAQMTLSEVRNPTGAVIDPERVAVREGPPASAAGSPNGAGPPDEPHGPDGDGEPGPGGGSRHRRSGA
ncbi:hypothetical protein ACFY64_17045 [Streptomyces collinus]|uniref:hypothetical protein n=1 Tax=Streptomyces collinus TaxID=42684 RepID=UPI0036C18009